MTRRRTAVALVAAAAVTLGGAVAVSRLGPANPGARPDSLAPSPTTAHPSPAGSPTPVRRELPPVDDATGLTGERLVAAAPVRLTGAAEDGTARVAAQVRGAERLYLLAPARRVAAGSRPALVLVLPAANTNLRTEYDRYRLDDLRDHGLTVVVVGTYAANWNAGRCCGRPAKEGVDDVAAVTAVRDDALRRSGADPRRVAVIGHSVGAFMAWRLACTPQFGAAAVVAVSGSLTAPCSPPMPRTPHLLAINGAADVTVPLDGTSRVVPLLGIAPPSVRASVAELASAGGCTTPGRASPLPGGEVLSYDACSGGSSVRLAVIAGRGHPWADLDATRRLAAHLAQVLPGVR